MGLRKDWYINLENPRIAMIEDPGKLTRAERKAKLHKLAHKLAKEQVRKKSVEQPQSLLIYSIPAQ